MPGFNGRKHCDSVFYNQERKCGLVFGTSYCILTGFSPCHSHNNFNWHRQ